MSELASYVVAFVVCAVFTEAYARWAVRRRARVLARQLFARIEHGDTEHRAWLKNELEEFFS